MFRLLRKQHPDHHPSIKLKHDEPQESSVGGVLFSVDQLCLKFGSNRQIWKDYRPAFGLSRHEQWLSVLPMTTLRGSKLFRIPPGRCHHHRAGHDNKTSYLSSCPETVALDAARKIGDRGRQMWDEVIKWLLQQPADPSPPFSPSG